MALTVVLAQHPGSRQHWSLEDISWHDIDHAAVVDHELLFYLVTIASFIETATDTYVRNLVAYYAGDQKLTSWLEQHWQYEELQHGRALKRYAQAAWPDFEWDKAYQAFFAEFSATCTVESLEPSRCLEMVSRCIVEMSTSSYYTALSRLSPDPVLSGLTRLIRDDEVRHYKYFYRNLRDYRAREDVGRFQIVKTIVRRLRMIDGEDGRIASKHVYSVRHPGVVFDDRLYRNLQEQCRYFLGPQLPHAMSAKMTLKPLDLSPWVQRAATPLIVFFSRCLLWGEGKALVKPQLHVFVAFYQRMRRYALAQWHRLAH